MKLEHLPVAKIKKAILDIADRHLDLKEYKIFFFGSRVSGKSHERSDIDVGIAGPRPVPLAVMWQLEEELSEIPTLYKIEIVDFGRVAPKFKEVVGEQVEFLAR